MQQYGFVWRLLLPLLLVPAASCTGQIAGTPSGDDMVPPPGTAPPGTDGTGTPGLPGGPAVPGGPTTPGNAGPPPAPPPSFVDSCGAAADPGYVGLRRLTRVEYDNIVRDLLGDTSGTAMSTFPVDDSVIADQALVSTLFLEKLQAAVQKQIEDAWTRDVATKAPATAKLMVCPIKPGDAACARTIISTFARKAWRRPVTTAEIDPFFALVTAAETKGDENVVGIKLALRSIMMSPEFVYRVETDATATARPLTAHELAVRLSFLLWSSTPDARLDMLADNGTLVQPAILVGELGRMLSDPKSTSFVQGFVNHWLSLGNLANARPDATLARGWDEPLRQAMTSETIQIFRAFLDEGRNVTDLLDADFTFVNAQLAQHYGLPAPAGAAPAEHRKVMLPAGPRRGLLAHGSLLSMTSAPLRTSPVKRGKYVLANLLCSKPPPPPPGVDTTTPAADMAKTERERLAIHRTNPQCAGCHAIIDPIGLGLENFDIIGRYRTTYSNGSAIDPAGELTGGGMFRTFDELRALIKKDERMPKCVSDQLFAYAIGRVPETADACVQKTINTQFGSGGRIKDLLSALTASPPFTKRRAETGGMP